MKNLRDVLREQLNNTDEANCHNNARFFQTVAAKSSGCDTLKIIYQIISNTHQGLLNFEMAEKLNFETAKMMEGIDTMNRRVKRIHSSNTDLQKHLPQRR